MSRASARVRASRAASNATTLKAVQRRTVPLTVHAPRAHAGSTTTPGRVYKGARGPGHMGHDHVTAANIKIVLVDPERNLLGIKGAVPGSKGSLVVVKEARKQ